MVDKEENTVDEEANEQLTSVPSPGATWSKKVLVVMAISSLAFFGAGLLAGAYGIDTSGDEPSANYHQVGQTIVTADNNRDVYSYSPISLGEDRQGRKRMAIGDRVYHFPEDPPLELGDSTEHRRGRVRVMELRGEDRWELVGREIYGPSESAAYGTSVDLSPDGNTLAVGGLNQIQIYQWDQESGEWYITAGNAWTEQEDEYSYCGQSVSLSEDGLAVGYTCPGRDAAYYASWTNGLWEEETIVEQAPLVATQVTLSGDGNTVLLVDGGQHALIYERESINRWVLQEQDIPNGSSLADSLLDTSLRPHQQDIGSNSYALSKQGSILAVLFASDGDSAQPVVRTFWAGNSPLKQFANDIVVPLVDDHLGKYTTHMALSDDGLRLVVSFSSNFGPSNNNHLYFYEYTWGQWQLSGQPLTIRAGASTVDMSSSGAMVAVSYNDGTQPEDFVVLTFQKKL